MDKVYIIFWTQGGNTGAMASAIGDGVKAAGKEPVFLSPSEAKVSELTELNGFAMGCPAMGCEVLEETEMEPFVSEVESILNGKKIALFGSYGWGDGQCMRDWEERMNSAGAIIIGGRGTIAHEMPQDEDIELCKDLGKQLAEL